MSRRILNTITLFVAGLSFSMLATGEPARTVPVDDLRHDSRYLYEQMQGSHYDLFARRSRAEYDQRFEQMLGSFTQPVSLTRAHIEFQKFLAYGRVAHARTDGYAADYNAHRAAGGRVMPLGIRVVRGKAYVVENPSGINEIRLGDELVALNGVPMGTWLERLGAYVSADNDYMAHTLLEFRFRALLWLELGTVERFDVRVQPAQGRAIDVAVPARSNAEMNVSSAGNTLDLDWNKREWRMHGKIAYLRPGPFYEPEGENMWDTRPWDTFIDGAFEAIVDAGAPAVLIDLRNNAGGDNSFSDRMVSWFADEPYRFVSAFRIRVSPGAIETNRKRLAAAPSGADTTSQRLDAAYRGRKPGELIDFEVPFACPRPGKRFKGDVYLLINRHSYSNTVMVAALAQDYGFATILGEETSDLSTTYGAMEQFDLPRTGLTIGFPKAQIIRPSGATDARGVVPDIAIETPIVEGSDDPVLQQAVRIVHDSSDVKRRNARRQNLSPLVAEARAQQKPCPGKYSTQGEGVFRPE